MTREEAIDIFEHNWTRLENHDYTDDELNEALDIAIKVLEQEPKTSHWICAPVRLLVDESYDEAIYDTKYKCTCESCGGDFGMMWKEWHPKDNYCKYCGAKMESEVI